ncbi:MAG: DinB family protein [Armatimonadetes bacterium]|nr:DinB family protein [Armatimonadota bacterium]
MSRVLVASLTEQLNRAYKGSKHHSFRSAVKDLAEEDARWAPPAFKGFPWAHGSIVEIVFHVGADKIVNCSQSFGEGAIDWTAMERRFRSAGSSLAAALEIAEEGYDTTLDALAALSDDDLYIERPIWGGERMRTGDMFKMLSEHDYYHAGQIMYVRCLLAGYREKGLV